MGEDSLYKVRGTKPSPYIYPTTVRKCPSAHAHKNPPSHSGDFLQYLCQISIYGITTVNITDGIPVDIVTNYVCDAMRHQALHDLCGRRRRRRLQLHVGFEAAPEPVLEMLCRPETSQPPVHLFLDRSNGPAARRW